MDQMQDNLSGGVYLNLFQATPKLCGKKLFKLKEVMNTN